MKEFEEFKSLRWREKTSVSDLMVKAFLEYLQNHKEGNPNYALEKWADPDFLAIPAYMAPEGNWQTFYQKINPALYQKIDARLNWLLRIHNGSNPE